MRRFYIASRIENYVAVRALAAALKGAGHVHTYDWTAHGAAYRAEHDAETNLRAMATVAHAEMDGVRAADVVVALLPGGRGTHAEIGAALGLGKPVLIVGEPETLTGAAEPRPCAFYYHPLVRRFLTAAEVVTAFAFNDRGA